MPRRSYTSTPAPSPDPFELDGVEFVPAGHLTMLDLSRISEFAELEVPEPGKKLSAQETARYSQVVATLHVVFRAALGNSEYSRFAEHVGQHGTDPGTLFAIFEGMAEDVGENPTGRSSPSSDGSTATAAMHTVISSSGTVTQLPLTPEREAELRAAVQRAALAG